MRLFSPKTRSARRKMGFTLEEVVVAMSIVGLTVSGTISGYVMVAKRSDWATRSAAADAAVMQRVEQVRAARWDPLAAQAVDEVVSASFPQTTVKLDLPQKAEKPEQATVRTTIEQISDDPPVRLVRVDCAWASLDGRTFTNSIVVYRTPDL
jgi:type II secretory pathway pseudopilin PulG